MEQGGWLRRPNKLIHSKEREIIRREISFVMKGHKIQTGTRKVVYYTGGSLANILRI
jgi:hypothetical protein